MQSNPLNNPMLANQHQQIIQRNKALAAQGGGGNAGLGALGSIAGGALGTALLGPLGGAVGSSLGGSLGGKGDLSGVTPESIALGAVTAGLGSKLQGAGEAAGEAAKGAGDAVSTAGTDALKATGNIETLGTTAGDRAIQSAGGFDAGAAMADVSKSMESVASGAVNESAKQAGKNPLFSGIKGVSDRIKDFQAIDPSDIASTAKDSLFETPDTYFEHFANKLYNPLFREEGGPIQPQKHIVEHKRKLSDLEKAMLLMSPILAASQGQMPGLASTLGTGVLGLACGGKAKHY